VHGDATITASTPVKNEPEILLEPKDPSLVKELPIFISVSKIIPIINIRMLSIPTIIGD
jgi:hypothetical protein